MPAAFCMQKDGSEEPPLIYKFVGANNVRPCRINAHAFGRTLFAPTTSNQLKIYNASYDAFGTSRL